MYYRPLFIQYPQFESKHLSKITKAINSLFIDCIYYDHTSNAHDAVLTHYTQSVIKAYWHK